MLGWATYRGQATVIRALSEMGADIAVVDASGWTLMFLAAREGNVEAIEVLNELGAPVSPKSRDGSTPAHVAAKAGKFNALKALVTLGADVLDRDNVGNTPGSLVRAHAFEQTMEGNNLEENKESKSMNGSNSTLEEIENSFQTGQKPKTDRGNEQIDAREWTRLPPEQPSGVRQFGMVIKRALIRRKT